VVGVTAGLGAGLAGEIEGEEVEERVLQRLFCLLRIEAVPTSGAATRAAIERWR